MILPVVAIISIIIGGSLIALGPGVSRREALKLANLEEVIKGLAEGMSLMRVLYRHGSRGIRSALLRGRLEISAPNNLLSLSFEDAVLLSIMLFVIDGYKTNPVLASRYLGVIRDYSLELIRFWERIRTIDKAMVFRSSFVLLVIGFALPLAVWLSPLINLSNLSLESNMVATNWGNQAVSTYVTLNLALLFISYGTLLSLTHAISLSSKLLMIGNGLIGHGVGLLLLDSIQGFMVEFTGL